MKLYLIFLLMLGVTWSEEINEPPNYYQPEQIHLSCGYKKSHMVVTWSTFNETESLVKYGLSEPDQQVAGASTLFVDGGAEQRPQWIHRATMTFLSPNTTYVYQVGSEKGWSQLFSFKTLRRTSDDAGPSLRVAIFGDMGLNNSLALPFLVKDVQEGMYDLILHLGDFAYDMDEQEGRVGDDFMNLIQPLAAYVPYMTCPGNHENAYNFSHYTSRFTMPGPSNLYYSFDAGMVHFVSLSTEVYYFTNYGMKIMADQYAWLRRDLTLATLCYTRFWRPWIVVVGHRPMYCSNSDDPDCAREFTRKGFLGLYGLEPLLQEFGVDLVVWAHEHSYERTWPLYDNVVYNGTDEDPYDHPEVPVHVVTGSAGCREGIDPFVKDPKPWSAFRSDDYGYTRLTVQDYSHVHIEQVSVQAVEAAATVVDSFTLYKTYHVCN